MSKEQLNAIFKRARDIMRKDAGLSSDLDRIPQLSWILFLKSFEDLEKRNELLVSGYKSAIPAPYRWSDWAANPEGKTGDDLLNFINNELLPSLRKLKGNKPNDPKDILAAIFAETYNRMLSGYLLREVVNSVEKIDFKSKDDIFTLSHLYESILKEMRDAAGTSGEFYTPRAVVRFIVEQTSPQLGERVLDPACGTGGFLVETYDYLKRQVKKAGDFDTLQYKTLFGVEKKPMPYLLGVMNLVLHGIEIPNIRRGNTLTKALNDITEKDRYEVIITNPPFGGEEEKGIQDNFPHNMRTAETALLFIQFIMRSLKNGGRCGIVVPNGFLFGDNVTARIKEQLLSDFNLHTIVRLPKGVFSPYTDIETNLLFFDKEGKTHKIWYYELPLPPGRKTYTKTKPLRYDEFAECVSLMKTKGINDNAWLVDVEDIISKNFNLDIKNPNKTDSLKHVSPEQLIKEVIHDEKQILKLLEQIQKDLD